ncbi:MAG: aminotransferase class III-fold pyridoxal phosphate-dependent enzyme [Allomuricauda sp.]|nr:MAG: aminotransferase class III-fold pyridoxal phosphate-dependent enzyme [Allomuricauda sp.]
MTLNTVLKSEFGLSNCKVKILNGYANKNYLVTAEEGRFIFKTYSDYRRLFEISEAENQLLLHLHAKKIADIPKPIAFNDGSFAKIIDIEGQENLCRLLTFVDGTFMADVPLTNAMVSSLGTYVATLGRALFDFDHMTLRARESNWDLQYALNNKKYIKDIPSVRKQNLVNYFIQQYEQQVLPELPELRKSCIHGDFNEWNILLNDQTVSGVIDFGDCGHTHLINELAITAAYVFYAAKDPLAFAEPLLQSYHAILPLQEKEISILYWLIAMRLCTSVCNSAHAKVSDPDNSYASVSEQKAWALLEKWLRIGPNRAEQIFRAAVGFDVIKTESLETALGRRKKYLSNILSVSYHRPIVMHRAAFQYMFDAQGASFLDAYNNIPHVGHQHPMVVEAAQKQLTQLNTNTRYLYDLLPDYAERLLAKFPNSLNKVFFVNSGSAASDLAIRLSMNHTKSRNLMVMEHGYHGNTQIGIDISDYKFNNPKGQGQRPHIFKTTLPDTYRGKYTQDDGTAGKAYAQEALQKIEKNSESIAAFISEPIVGCGGQIPLAKDYLKPIYAAIRAQGGICISDEVQTGFGRLGDVFWGFEHQGVVPDIVVLGKPMGNGHPIGAVVTTDEIAASFEDGVEFFSSFGGNPVSCAIGMAVLEVIDKEGLQKNAHEVGNYYQDCLNDLKTRYPVIGDVRGSGLFLGIDIVKPGTRDPDTALAHHLKNALREQYVLVSTDGPADNVIKSKPPLCFTKDNVDEVVEKMATILSAYGT